MIKIEDENFMPGGENGGNAADKNLPSGANKFEVFLREPYEEIARLIEEQVENGNIVIDLGCNNGNLVDKIEKSKSGCKVYGVDLDREALDLMRAKEYSRNEVAIIEQDANDFLVGSAALNADVILINTAIHEINDPDNQAQYLDGFFRSSRRTLKDGGRVIIGDLYYDPSVSDAEVEAFMEYQKQAIGHADPRNKFIMPDLLQAKAEEHGFSVAYSNEIRAVKEVNRRYYTFVFVKK
jgi:SAM-dependent methyltransferase